MVAESVAHPDSRAYRTLIREWFESNEFIGVGFTENLAPEHSRDDDYQIVGFVALVVSTWDDGKPSLIAPGESLSHSVIWLVANVGAGAGSRLAPAVGHYAQSVMNNALAHSLSGPPTAAAFGAWSEAVTVGLSTGAGEWFFRDRSKLP